MKVAVLIMSSDAEPSTSNVKTMSNTFIADTVRLMNENKLRHTYDFFVYSYSEHLDSNYVIEKYDDVNHMYISGKESIYNTFEKTITALDKVGDEYDWYIRLNISSFLNIRLLDIVLEKLDKDKVYCNAINTYITDERYFNHLYPRGDFLLFTNEVKGGILKCSKKYIRCDYADKDRLTVPHVDDCMIGLCLIDYFGPQYYDHLQMLTYSFLPMYENIDNIWQDKYSVISRVKTIPPDKTCSGYSWEDNEYRRADCEKMEILNKSCQTLEYSDILIKTLLEKVIDSYNFSRPTFFIRVCTAPISTIIQCLSTMNSQTKTN